MIIEITAAHLRKDPCIVAYSNEIRNTYYHPLRQSSTATTGTILSLLSRAIDKSNGNAIGTNYPQYLQYLAEPIQDNLAEVQDYSDSSFPNYELADIVVMEKQKLPLVRLALIDTLVDAGWFDKKEEEILSIFTSIYQRTYIAISTCPRFLSMLRLVFEALVIRDPSFFAQDQFLRRLFATMNSHYLFSHPAITKRHDCGGSPMYEFALELCAAKIPSSPPQVKAKEQVQVELKEMVVEAYKSELQTLLENMRLISECLDAITHSPTYHVDLSAQESASCTASTTILPASRTEGIT